MLTVANLIACGVGPTQARIFCDPINAACALFDITTKPRLAAFIGQCMVESVEFIHLEENLFYSNPERIVAVWPRQFATSAAAMPYVRNPQKLASKVYADRLGNGDEPSEDGWKFRGRGVIEITGRDNYSAAADGCSRPYVDHPDLVAQPSDACLSSAWFWNANGLNALADSGAIDAITRAVNGPGMLAAASRRQYTEQAMRALA